MTNDTVWPTSIWQRYIISYDPELACGPWYTLNAVLELRGQVDHRLLDVAFNQLLMRHDLLRSRIDRGDQGMVQVVSGRVEGTVEIVDRDFSIEEITYTPVEFDRPSPIRLRLASRSSNEHLMAVHIHHVMADPTTLWIVACELGTLYSGLISGQSLPEPGAQYGEYVLAEAQLAAADRSIGEKWWRTLFSPASRARTLRDSQTNTGEGLSRTELLTAVELSALERWAWAHRNIVFAALLAAMARGMAPHYESEGGLLFSTLFSRRDRPEWQRMVGPCTVPAFLWVPKPSQLLSAGYVETVRDMIFGCYRHARVPDVESLTGTAWQEQIHGTYTVPFVEYLPKGRPRHIDFGSARAIVVNAAGPQEAGHRRGFDVRVRRTDDGALVGRLSWDGNGWTERLVKQVCEDLRGQVNHLVGDAGRSAPTLAHRRSVDRDDT
jgi:hypothetical protein